MSRVAEVLRLPGASKLAKGVLGVVIAISAARALAGYRHVLAGRLQLVRFEWLVVAAVLGSLYRVVNAYGWVLVLRSLGQPMRAAAGVRLWLVSETMRWLPGGVWGLFSRVAQARAAGIPAAAASLSFMALGLSRFGRTAVVVLMLHSSGYSRE